MTSINVQVEIMAYLNFRLKKTFKRTEVKKNSQVFGVTENIIKNCDYI